MPHSSVEAGERALPDPVERRGCRVVDETSEPRRGHSASQAKTTQTRIQSRSRATRDRDTGRVRPVAPKNAYCFTKEDTFYSRTIFIPI